MKKKSIDIEHSCLDPGVKHRDDEERDGRDDEERDGRDDEERDGRDDEERGGMMVRGGSG